MGILLIKYLIDTYDILITDINQLKLLEYNYEKTKIRIVESKEDNLIESFFEVMTDIIDKDEFKTLIDNTDRVRDYKFLEDKNNIIWNKANNLKTVDNLNNNEKLIKKVNHKNRVYS